MISLNLIANFFFIFSILVLIRISFIFLRALLQNPPEIMRLSSRELIFLGINLSYFITYILN